MGLRAKGTRIGEAGKPVFLADSMIDLRGVCWRAARVSWIEGFCWLREGVCGCECWEMKSLLGNFRGV